MYVQFISAHGYLYYGSYFTGVRLFLFDYLWLYVGTFLPPVSRLYMG